MFFGWIGTTTSSAQHERSDYWDGDSAQTTYSPQILNEMRAAFLNHLGYANSGTQQYYIREKEIYGNYAGQADYADFSVLVAHGYPPTIDGDEGSHYLSALHLHYQRTTPQWYYEGTDTTKDGANNYNYTFSGYDCVENSNFIRYDIEWMWIIACQFFDPTSDGPIPYAQYCWSPSYLVSETGSLGSSATGAHQIYGYQYDVTDWNIYLVANDLRFEIINNDDDQDPFFDLMYDSHSYHNQPFAVLMNTDCDDDQLHRQGGNVGTDDGPFVIYWYEFDEG